ncbi:serine protease [Saccharopolyspora oryzae]|uniref:Serine protease n=1 Tax=Saccharopolyspora oryzae TaxID=2997343 RepID=A0ABT4V998_9PSEU|nr:serine protease [Saccharopolyspora oryzae]MDA3630545.1 serine protease [Saccharopolyspora oryzae]
MPRGSLKRGILALAATALAGLVLATPIASATATPLIIGGTKATQTYSFIASMQSSDGQHHCGASLIAPQWLVTAAHCVKDQKPSDIHYRIGTSDRTSGGEVVKPDKFVAHPQYKEDQAGYDIALVHLSKSAESDPIQIASSQPQPGTALHLLGWGQTCGTPKCGEPPVNLKELETKTTSPSKCTSADNPFDASRELCIDNQDGKVSACYGDSGGPAVINEGSGYALVGATSRGQAENCADKPGIYTDVVAHTDWISQTMSSGGSSGSSEGKPGKPGGSPGGSPGSEPGKPGKIISSSGSRGL